MRQIIRSVVELGGNGEYSAETAATTQ